jgi:serine-type D-Ala-D-Ala carboxypeptidase/endopeptidase (penicillin-binding protein 4)
VKKLLERTLTVKQVLAAIVIPIALITVTIVFSTGAEVKSDKIAIAGDSIQASSVLSSDTSAYARLKNYVDSLNGSKELFGGSWSFYLADADSGNSVCAVDIDRALVPASTMKIVTTGTALEILGPGYHFATTLQYDGTFDKSTGILNGNLYIHGGGDPSLGSEVFGSSLDKVMEEWCKSIRTFGIDSISGAVIGDAESFDRDPIPVGWTWEDIQSSYGAGPCGLNIRENVYDLICTAGANGVSIKTSPAIPGLKLYNQMLKNPSVAKSYAYVQGAPFQFERTALGEVATEHVERSAIPDPALFCAQTLRSALSASGVHLKDSVSTIRLMRLNNLPVNKREARKPIETFLSPSLADLVYHTNQVSQNFYAESILRAIALHENGYGNGPGAVNTIYKFWKDRQLDLRGICMVDGCGLSRMNVVTTHQLVEMLRTFSKDSAVFRTFYRSLPVAGESGTIRKLADGTAADGNLHAKSGTMSRVKSYAGYVKTKSGKLLCFAMIGNNTLWTEVELKYKFERLFVLMAELQ